MKLIKSHNELKMTVAGQLEALGVEEGSSILIAYSGGPDSTALFHVLLSLADPLKLRLGCGYFDHKLRNKTECSKEILHVQQTTSKYQVELFIGEGTDISRSHLGIEAEARRQRYGFLLQILQSRKYQYLAVGHTLDDQLETIIQRVFQGAGSDGLTGIPAKRGPIVRPLLASSRVQIESYLKKNKIGWTTDSSNTSANYLRNRIRSQIVPVISEVFPHYAAALDRLAEKQEQNAVMLRRLTAQTLPADRDGETWWFDRKAFVNASPGVRIQALLNLYDTQFGVQNQPERLPYRFLRSLVSLPPLKTGDWLLNGYGFALRVAEHRIEWTRHVVFTGKKRYFMVVNGREKTGVLGMWGNTSIQVAKDSLDVLKRGVWFSVYAVQFPLLIRSREAGDSIRLECGAKSLKKLYCEWRVPKELRWQIPLLEDSDGIFCVAGSLFGFPTRYADGRNRKGASEGEFLSLTNLTVGE